MASGYVRPIIHTNTRTCAQLHTHAHACIEERRREREREMCGRDARMRGECLLLPACLRNKAAAAAAAHDDGLDCWCIFYPLLAAPVRAHAHSHLLMCRHVMMHLLACAHPVSLLLPICASLSGPSLSLASSRCSRSRSPLIVWSFSILHAISLLRCNCTDALSVCLLRQSTLVIDTRIQKMLSAAALFILVPLVPSCPTMI